MSYVNMEYYSRRMGYTMKLITPWNFIDIFLKKMKVVTRNTQDAIILSAAKSQDNFNPHLLEALG